MPRPARVRVEDPPARHDWGSEWVVAPALITLAGAVIWTGDLDEGERCLDRAALALRTDSGPGIKVLLHMANGMLQAGRGLQHAAFEEFSAAERLRSQLAGSHAVAGQVTGWMLATQARRGSARAKSALPPRRLRSRKTIRPRPSARCGTSWTAGRR